MRALKRQVKNPRGTLSTRKQIELHTRVNNYGYRVVGLYKDGRSKTNFIHKMVASAFIPNPNQYKQVNHLDGIKLNNIIENLEWCTHRQNAIHASKIGLLRIYKGSRNVNAKVKEEDVINIRREYARGIYQEELARKYKVSQTTISFIINKVTWRQV